MSLHLFLSITAFLIVCKLFYFRNTKNNTFYYIFFVFVVQWSIQGKGRVGDRASSSITDTTSFITTFVREKKKEKKK